jgi:hypothetical protein
VAIAKNMVHKKNIKTEIVSGHGHISKNIRISIKSIDHVPRIKIPKKIYMRIPHNSLSSIYRKYWAMKARFFGD